ncbi:c2 domain-containing protein [Ditylenchus destructor]|uniref:C2 domain-containing protein n=1 Tax=Ditylenchus destructor TaxID=166010 RepID=A0AAD4NIE6_9BILA|nr:c2 domain-containing protein [Ditylenchus destructor]
MNNIHQQPNVRRARNKSGGEIKRILLTRKYKHENFFKDLGIRVTGGKRLRSGDLGAFITAINRNKALETLGQLQEGDQVLEWNGVLLGGKTFEEVERIITASTGEIEIIVKSHNRTKGSNSTGDTEDGVALYDAVNREQSSANLNSSQRALKSAKMNVNSLKEAPPIPAHRPNYSSQTQYSRSDDSPESNREPDPSPMRNSNMNAANAAMALNYHRMNGSRMGGDIGGHLQVSLSYDHFNAILMVRVISARGLRCREYNNSTIVLPNPFVKIYLLPGRKVANKRRTKYIPSSADPEWNQTVDYLINSEDLPNHYLELTVWDYDKYNDNICLGQIVIRFSDPSLTYNVPRWYPLEQISTNAIQIISTDDQTNYASLGDGRRLQIGQRRQNQSSLPNRTNGVYHDQQLYSDYPANLDAIGYPAIA